MKVLLVGLLLSSSLYATEYEYEIDVTSVGLEHAWRPPEDFKDATFNDVVFGLGATVWRDEWGIRVAYYDGKPLHTDGYYEYVTINLEHIISFELLYRYHITSDLRLVAGIGTHLIPVPQYFEGIDPDSHMANDADNDEGYILGLQYKINDDMSIGWRFTHYSRIRSNGWDEWIKGHSVYITYHF